MHGQGTLTHLDKTVYEGTFENGKRHGTGRFHIKGSTYSLVSNFVDNKPEYEGNQLIYKLIQKEEVVEPKVDPKAKKVDPKAAAKKGAPVEEDKDAENKLKIVYETGKESNFIEFELHVVFQGPPYEDPNPPPIEEDPKKAKGKGKAAQEPE